MPVEIAPAPPLPATMMESEFASNSGLQFHQATRFSYLGTDSTTISSTFLTLASSGSAP